MKILHADDHPMFREGIQFFLKLLDSDVDVVEASSFQALMDKLVLETPVDLLLLDLDMPGMGALEGFFTIRRRYPELSVAVLSGINNTQTIRVLLDGGARGFIPKSASSEELLAALRLITAGETYIPKSLFVKQINSVADSSGSSSLTKRQLDLIALLAEGMQNKLIANALGITEGTVKQHLKTIFKKLNVQNRTQAMQAVHRLGLLKK
jgi:DNA-binding NarL/FixJ family response regulator